MATLCAIHVRPSAPYGPLVALDTAKPGNSKGIVMNIALNPEASAEKSRETYRKTHGQFEAVTLIPREAREFAETSG